MSNAIFGVYDSGDEWKLLEERMELEEMALKDCFEEFLRRVPRFHELAARLKPGRVQDPFLDGDGHLRSERQTICGKFSFEVKSNVGISSKEVFRKQSIYEQNEAEPCYLSSPVINYSDDCRDDYANLESFVGIIEEKDEILLEHGNYTNELQCFCQSGKWSEREIISGEPVPLRTTNFLELNQQGTRQDSVETSVPLLLESPPPYGNLWTCTGAENHENDVVKRSVDLDPIKMKPENSPLLSPHSISKMTRQIGFSSKLLDKISSLILEVPDLKENFKNQQMTTSNSFSSLLKEDFTSELELQLHWDPLPKSPRGVTNLQLKRYDDIIPKSSVPDLKLTHYDDCISNRYLPVKNSNPVLNVSCKKLPWKDVYGFSKDVLKGCFDLVKEIKINVSRVDTPEGEKQCNSPIYKVMKKPVEICRKYSYIHSGIDDFVLLRTGVKSTASSNCPPILSPNENLKQEIYTLIGSSKVTGNIDLLRCLEQRCDIMIIEREYAKILKGEQTTPSKMCLQPDLMLDQKSGVIIENIINFASEEGYKNAVDLVLSTSFKCQMCSIILVCDTHGSSAYSFLGEVQSHLAKFHGCLVSIQASFPQFVVDVFYSHSVPQTASLIRKLCEITRDSSSVFSKQDWAKRNWLTGEISEHERFLLGFPSLNSFSVQLMLNVMPLHTLLSLPFDTLKKELPWISENTLKDFKTTADCGLVLEQSEDFLVQVPRFPPEDCNDHGDTNYPMDTDMENSQPNVTYEKKCPISESAGTSYYFNPVITSERIPKMDQELFRSRTSKCANWLQLTNSRSEMSTKNRISGGFQFKNDLCDTNESQFYALGYRNNICLFERKPQGGSLSPGNSNLEQVIGGVSRNFNSTRFMCNKGKLKSAARSSTRWKEVNEMPDVIGVVQPKPRKPERYKPERPGSRVPGSVKNIWSMVPPNSERISNLGYLREGKKDDYSMKPKKRKLTFEVVPGAKNGQTRLTFV